MSFSLVEARGVEPLSERTAAKASPSAAGILLLLMRRLPAGFSFAIPDGAPAVSPGIKRKRVSLLSDARYRPAGLAGRTDC